jgi:hypothetical protein
MADDDFGFAVRHRLGMPCVNGLPMNCDCGTALLTDTAHFHSCHRLRGIDTTKWSKSWLVYSGKLVLRFMSSHVSMGKTGIDQTSM